MQMVACDQQEQQRFESIGIESSSRCKSRGSGVAGAGAGAVAATLPRKVSYRIQHQQGWWGDESG